MSRRDKWALLDDWLTDAQQVLQLAHWTLSVARDASDVDAWADIDPHAQNLTAELRLSHDFWRQPPDRQRLVLTHELLHLACSRTDRVVETLEDALGKVAWAVYSPQYEDASERMIDHLASVIAQQLPLPEFPKA
jgi:hypothetical protein